MNEPAQRPRQSHYETLHRNETASAQHREEELEMVAVTKNGIQSQSYSDDSTNPALRESRERGLLPLTRMVYRLWQKKKLLVSGCCLVLVLGLILVPVLIMPSLCDENGVELDLTENTTTFAPILPNEKIAVDSQPAISRFPPGGSWKTESSPLHESLKYSSSPRVVAMSGDGTVIAVSFLELYAVQGKANVVVFQRLPGLTNRTSRDNKWCPSSTKLSLEANGSHDSD